MIYGLIPHIKCQIKGYFLYILVDLFLINLDAKILTNDLISNIINQAKKLFLIIKSCQKAIF